uniref:Glycine receptor subunit alphaZ1-like n=1 Tax=Parastrongyloides trichosuri TaxID=131310 RepID=A0A0N4Z2K4_PARTI
MMEENGYNKRIRPDFNEDGEPVHVDVDFFLRSISNFNELNMEYSAQITLRQSWIDERLAFKDEIPNSPEYFALNDDSKLWIVDSFFRNEKNGHRHMIDKPNMLVRIYKDGKVVYSVRLTLVLSCPMYLQKYPMDVQECYIDMASYGYTKDDIIYHWNKETPVQFRDELTKSLPQFELEEYSTTTCESFTKLGNFSCLRFEFSLKRKFGYYLLHLFIPSIMLVMVSWISFYLDPNAVPGRVTLGTVTLLTLIANSNGISSKLPPVSYIKAIDVWILFCVLFVFIALIEFAVTCFLYNRKPSYLPLEKISEGKVEEGNDINDEIPKKCSDRLLDRFSGMKAKEIDSTSRLLFPVCFLIFNVFFWSFYS